MKATQAITRKDADEMMSRVMLLKHDLMALGFLKTAHAMEPATQQAGWEMSEMLEGKHPTTILPL